jgi:5,10-methylenetetrahydrofolate reductase
MFEKFIKKLQNEKFITLETTPKHSATFEPIIDTIKELELHKKVDGFSVTDSPLAKLKYSSLFASLKLQTVFKKPALATMTMRDRNKIGLQSSLLGANEFDIRAILALTGDSASMSDQPNTKGVFEANSTLLLDIIKCFNVGIDYAGRTLDSKPKTIYSFAVSNAYAKNPKTLQKKLKDKLERGIMGVITQPVYSLENAKNLLEIFERAKIESGNSKATLIIGYFPIIRLKTAQFLTSHVPGITVPNSWSEKLYDAKKISDKEEKKIGFELSKKILDELLNFHPKVHLMTANNFKLAQRLLT